MPRYPSCGLSALLLLLSLACLSLGVLASSSSSPIFALPSPAPLLHQLWDELQSLLSSDVGFALLLLPFSVSAFPLAYLLLRSASPTKTVSLPSTPAFPNPFPPHSSPPSSTTSPPSPPRYSSTSSPLIHPFTSIHHFTPTRPPPISSPSSPTPPTPSHSDFLIIGAGIVGSTLSTLLSRLGYTVTTLERDLSQPHRIVGELLQPGGCLALHSLGLGAALQGFDGQRVDGYTILMPGREPLRLTYPARGGRGKHGEWGGRGTEEGRSFHHGRFVMSLRGMAKAEKGVSLVEGTAVELLEGDGGEVRGARYEVREADGKLTSHAHLAALTIVADGCLSSFRRHLTSAPHTKLSSFLGLILTSCPLPTPHHGHVILAHPTPILAYPISSTEVRMLIDYPNGTLPASKEAVRADLEGRVCAQLPEGMRPAFMEAVRGGAWSSMPNQSLVCRPKRVRGVLLMGDAVNMRHPLTGGGMTVGVKDVQCLVRCLQGEGGKGLTELNDADKVERVVGEYYGRRGAGVRAINILADALYAVFSADYAALRLSCFNYLSEGEGYSGGPVRLLSGVAESQLLLVYHFFSVAVYGAVHAVWPWQGWGKVKECACMLRDACAIIVPLLEAQNTGLIKMLLTAFRTVTRL